MGCSMSNDNVEAGDVYVKTKPVVISNGCHFDDQYFTQAQKQIIKQTWEKVNSNKVDKGIKIFLRIFQVKPEAKKLFPFRDLEGEALLNDSTFRMHAMRFVHAIGNTVQHLDALDVSCAPTLVLLGRKHAWIKGFLTDGYLEAFVDSVATVFETEVSACESGEVYTAWREVFKFLISKLCEGYKQAQEDASSELDKKASLEGNNCAHKSVQNDDKDLNVISEGKSEINHSNDTLQLVDVSEFREVHHSECKRKSDQNFDHVKHTITTGSVCHHQNKETTRTDLNHTCNGLVNAQLDICIDTPIQSNSDININVHEDGPTNEKIS